MTEFLDQDLSGARFERVSLRDATFTQVHIAPLVDRELNRLMPERTKMRPDDVEGFKEAWAILGRLWEGIPWDREARPTLDTVLAVRRDRQAMVGAVMDSLTDEQLASQASNTEPGWPRVEAFPFKECLLIVLDEEWEHRRYAERDLAALGSAVTG